MRNLVFAPTGAAYHDYVRDLGLDPRTCTWLVAPIQTKGLHPGVARVWVFGSPNDWARADDYLAPHTSAAMFRALVAITSAGFDVAHPWL